MKLFKYEGFKVVISEEALLVKEFKSIWNRDKSKDKNLALQELGYVYFMCDPRSDFMDTIDKEERSNQIIQREGMNPKWKPDELIDRAMDVYLSFVPASATLLQSTKSFMLRLADKLDRIDFDSTDDNGRPIYTIDKGVTAAKAVLPLVKELNKAERELHKDLTQEDRGVRGSREKSMFEDE